MDKKWSFIKELHEKERNSARIIEPKGILDARITIVLLISIVLSLVSMSNVEEYNVSILGMAFRIDIIILIIFLASALLYWYLELIVTSHIVHRQVRMEMSQISQNVQEIKSIWIEEVENLKNRSKEFEKDVEEACAKEQRIRDRYKILRNMLNERYSKFRTISTRKTMEQEIELWEKRANLERREEREVANDQLISRVKSVREERWNNIDKYLERADTEVVLKIIKRIERDYRIHRIRLLTGVIVPSLFVLTSFIMIGLRTFSPNWII